MRASHRQRLSFDRRPDQTVRRLLRAERAQHGCHAGRHPCADRPERRGQDHVLQSPDRRVTRRHRHDRLRRPDDRRCPSVEAHAEGNRPHIPEHPAVSASDGAGNRDDRRALPRLSVRVEGAWRCRAAASLPANPRQSARCRRTPSSCWNFLGLPTSATTKPPTCPMATSASLNSRARLPHSRGCCCWTNRPPA